MPTTDYTFDKLFGYQGEGTSSIDLTAGTSYTFNITNNTGSSYFVMETAQQPNLSVVPKNTSGSYTSLTNIASIVIGDYITGFALPTGTNSFIFTPSINVTGSTLRLRGTGGITLALSSNSSFDPDAQAFITAASITDPTQQSAINTLVIGMKADNLWDKMKAIYPFVGGTAFTHKFNLKDPRDLDAAFRLAFSGGITHSSNGFLPNGTNGYADTFLTPSTSLSLNSTHLSVYSRTNVARNNGDIGSENSAGTNRLYTLYNAVDSVDYSRNNNALASGLSTNSSLGFILNNRTNSTNMKVIRNNSIVTANSNATTGLSDRKIYVGALNSGGTAVVFSNRQLAFASIGDGLSDTEASNLYTRVQAFQTTLNRQV